MNLRYEKHHSVKVAQWQKKVDDFNVTFVCEKSKHPNSVRIHKAFDKTCRYFRIINDDAYSNVIDELLIPMNILFELKIPHSFYRI